MYYKLHNGMVFIGDQAWFYLSARDLLLGKSFPLVGITSSHTWLHQGPLWTYLLAIALWVGKFNPVAGAYLSIGINTLTIVSIYALGRRMFSIKAALTASFLYAFSPYIIENSVMPFCPSPIPLCTMIYFYCLYRWVKGDNLYFSFSVMSLALLYNFELATVILAVPLILCFGYGFLVKKSWVTTLTRKDIIITLLLGIIPMIPVIIYDIHHGFKQTIVYAGWLIYHPLRSLLGLGGHQPQGSISQTLVFLYQRLGQLVFLPNFLIALILFIVSISFLAYKFVTNKIREGDRVAYGLLLSWLFVAVFGIIFNRTPSDAYLPILFVSVFLGLGIAITQLPKQFFQMAIALLVLISVLNIVTFIKHNYFVEAEGLVLSKREEAVNTMINSAHNKPFQVIGKGPGSQFRSFTMPYEYLAWYKGYPVSSSAQVIFSIYEKGSRINVVKND